MADDFNGLGLSVKVIDAVAAAGYTKPTDIQAEAIPLILQKKDIIGIAQTGTGKTAGFVLPMLTLLESGRARARMPRTLILEPTRELAAQVSENFEKYGKNNRLTMALIIGGVSFEDQNKKLDRGVDVLIATPGRLLDQIDRGKIMLNGVEILVIDEADRMLDMGFIDDIEKICSRLPPRRQTLLFSATMDAQIERLTKKFLKDPVHVQVSRAASTADTIEQRSVKVSSDAEDKRAALRALIRAEAGLTNAIIFCNRKRDVATLARSLERHGFSAGGLHGDMDQKSRTETLDAFKNNRLTLLVASDVAARGLDIPAVSHVFNFDVPTHAEDYVHRIGRTGRAGRSGVAITLRTPSDTKYIDAITKLIHKDIPETTLPGDATPAISGGDGTPTERPTRARRGATRGRPERGTPAPRPEAAKPARVESTEQPRAENVDRPRAEKTERPRSENNRRGQTNSNSEPRTTRRESAPPRDEAPEWSDRKVEGIDAKSPFGSDGPIPAFLLRR